ncbi:dynein axonemal intermediate chain 1 isoform X2 [Danio rerio]|uniref:Dynein axonemal intermediate chain 1 isoform X2 n=1 Tax=Danio rerio TaxID=7955 RepID=A0AC58IAL8_DANRE
MSEKQPQNESNLSEKTVVLRRARLNAATSSLMRFSFKECCFKPVADEPDIEIEGSLVHKDSEEGQILCAEKEVGRKSKTLFSCITTATQTTINPPREVACQTESQPLLVNYSATANQWEIYDFYQEELQKRTSSTKKDEKENEIAEGAEGVHGNLSLLRDFTDKSDHDLAMLSTAAKLLEYAVNENINGDIIADFKHFEDEADEFRGDKGTLLPLWEFQYNKVKSLPVSALCWNKKYNDLFAVGLGSHKFTELECGMLLFYTWRNNNHPEFLFNTDSGVMCVDIHEQKSHLVAVGLFNGNVCVYNLMAKGDQPIYNSMASSGKHSGTVWQVKWWEDDLYGNHTFFSVSADGRVVSWTLGKYELFSTNIIKLPPMDKVPDDLNNVIVTAGLTLDFHKQKPYHFLVGTEAGKIHKGSTHYTRFIKTYEAHFRMVSCVRWNPFNPKVFITCGMDWRVNIWDETTDSPVFTFDLKSSVMDVAWAPYSSTVFAAVTADGKVHVFDLSINRFEALCQQRVVSTKRHLTCIEFNPVHPIIIVGNDRGLVISLKLSPNLRKNPKEEKGKEPSTGAEVEIAKMEKLLILMR